MPTTRRSKKSQLTEVGSLLGLALGVVVIAIGGYFLAGAIFYHQPKQIAPWALKGAPNIKPQPISAQ